MVPVKLVFVDDDPDDRLLIQECLYKLGATDFVVLASSCALLNYLGSLKEEDLPEAVILDWNMPEMDGLQILKHLKSTEEYQKIIVYMLTTSSRSDLKQLSITEGAAGFYTKPTSLIKLHDMLKEIYASVV